MLVPVSLRHWYANKSAYFISYFREQWSEIVDTSSCGIGGGGGGGGGLDNLGGSAANNNCCFPHLQVRHSS